VQQRQALRGAVGRAGGHALHEATCGRPSEVVVAEARHQQVQADHDRARDEEGLWEVRRRLHLRHHLEVHPLPRVGVHEVGRAAKHCGEVEALRHRVRLDARRPSSRGELAKRDPDAEQHEQQVEEAEGDRVAEPPQADDERREQERAEPRRGGEAQARVVKDALQGGAEDEEVGGVAEERVAVHDHEGAAGVPRPKDAPRSAPEAVDAAYADVCSRHEDTDVHGHREEADDEEDRQRVPELGGDGREGEDGCADDVRHHEHAHAPPREARLCRDGLLARGHAIRRLNAPVCGCPVLLSTSVRV